MNLLKTLFFISFVVSTYSLDISKEGYVRFIIALKQLNIDVLENLLLTKISNITSPDYGNYLTISEINKITSIPKNDKKKVTTRLAEYNIYCKDYGDSLNCIGYYENINSLFNTKIISDWQRNRYTTLNRIYHIPEDISKHIDFIEGLVDISYKKARIGQKPEILNYDGFYAQEVINRLYGIKNPNITNNNISVCSVEYNSNQGFLQEGLVKQQQLNNEPTRRISKNHIIGPNQGEDTESELDIQMMSQTSENVELWFWDEKLWLYSFAIKFFNTVDVPDIISMSWGWAEDEQCSIADCNKITSAQYVKRVNAEYVKIALRGITILAASGDAGAPGRTNEDCEKISPVNPIFPGSSPWVTSVGGSMALGSIESDWKTPLCKTYGCVNGTYEVGINYKLVGWTSGGGFSLTNGGNLTNWQKREVEKYIKNSVHLPKNFNRFGRGYPDLSAIGHNCPVWQNGFLFGIDGTSCSTPITASLFAIINNFMVQNNRPKVGFINPLLYKLSNINKTIYNDIVMGYNYCTEASCCPGNLKNGSDFGYLCSKGWDPVTGLGSLNINRFIENYKRYFIERRFPYRYKFGLF